MSQGVIKTCPGCGRSLRFPAGVGGLTMACPDCGRRFLSCFTLGGVSGQRSGAAEEAPPDRPAGPRPASPGSLPGAFSRRV